MVCALKDSYTKSLAWNVHSQVIHQHFLVFFTCENLHTATEFFLIIFFQDKYTWAKIMLHFKTGKEKLSYDSLIFLLFLLYKTCPGPTFLCYSLSVLWEQGLCHLWFIKLKEQKGREDTTHQVLWSHFLWLPVVRGFIPGDIIEWQSSLLDNDP